MSDENETCFHVYYGGRFNTGDNGYVSYVGGDTKIIKAPARLLFNRLATITPLYGFYGMRIWYKLPYEKLNELVILYNGSDAFHKLCEIGAWVKLIEVYMEKDDNVTDTERAVDIASPQDYRNDETESCEEEARINAVLSHEDDSDNDDIPRTPPASDCERIEEDYERWVRGSGELKIKQIFMSVKEFREAVVEYALKGGWNIKFARWGTIKSEAVCGVVGEIKCPWRIYCSYDESVNGFMVKTFFEQHSCIKDGRCRILSDNIIAELFVNDVRNDPDMKPKMIQEQIEARFNIIVTHDQCRSAKRKALRIIQNEYDEQYSRIKDYELHIRESNPGSTVELKTSINDGSQEKFEKFYVCFEALRSTWVKYCRPIIGIDGCFLKSGTKGQLLTAVGRDANNQIYPVAWAVVEVEDKDNWFWFIEKLQTDLHLGDGEGFTLISDRQKGLLIAVNQLLPKVEHRMCARHIYGNLHKVLAKKPQMRKMFWELVDSYTVADFESNLERIKEVDPIVHQALMQRNPKNCCRAFFKTHSCCEDALNNFSETYNNTINKARAMPLVEMLETIRKQCMVRIEIRRQKALKHKGKYSFKVYKVIRREEDKRKYCRSLPGPTGHFEVIDQGISYKVNMLLRTCSCRRWELTGIPCRHSLRVVLDKKLNVEDYVSHWYLGSTWQHQYNNNIMPLEGVKFWKNTGASTLKAPLREIHKGRSKKPQKRIKGVNETAKIGKSVTKHGRIMHCRRCGVRGHYSSKCGNVEEVPAKSRPLKIRNTKNGGVAECITPDVGEGPSQGHQTQE